MAEAILVVRDLVKRFGGLVATDHVGLEVRRGEVHALIGPNGAGKTTLIAQLSGTLASDSGSVHFDGEAITAWPQNQRVRRGLARSYQITSIFGKFTVQDNVALAVQARSGSSMSFWRKLAREAALFEEARALVARVGLGGREGAIAATLAHGEQRQLEVGLALATHPKLLLLDEPMAGMGRDESARMLDLIEALRRDVAVLLVEHDMEVVFRLADRISVLVNGRLIATGTPDEIRVNPEVRRAYLGDELQAAAKSHE